MSGTPEAPRVLVLSRAIPETHFAGSLLLHRLFSHFPTDRLLSVGPAPHPSSELLSARYQRLEPAWSARLNTTRFAAFKRSLEAWGVLGRIPLRKVERLVGSFHPDVVVTVMETLDYSDVARRYAERHRIPLVLVLHDRVDQFEPVTRAAGRVQLERYGAIYRAAAVRLCISPGLRDWFERRFGLTGLVLY